VSIKGFGPARCAPTSNGSPLLRHRIELGIGSVADDELGAPPVCISELHYPDIDAETTGLTLALAGGGCLSTWQGQRR
jgi:urease accessory protein